MVRDDTAWPTSFVNVCVLLDLNPDRIRERFPNWNCCSPRIDDLPLILVGMEGQNPVRGRTDIAEGYPGFVP